MVASTISVPIETSQFLEVARFLDESQDRRDPVLAIRDAIDYWLENASSKPELLSINDTSSTRGHQWKSLFLPDGTEVRMFYKGEYHYAKVDSDQLIFRGKPTTPSAFANAVTQSSRNAWRDLWIKRPTDASWTLADELRKRED